MSDIYLGGEYVLDEVWNKLQQELALLRSENERMADVVIAALRWVDQWKNSYDAHSDSDQCDCTDCDLIRACDKYVAEEK